MLEWQQVSSSLQDSSQYSSRSQQGCSLHGLHTSSYFQVFQPFCINPLVTVPKAPITICITITFMFHSFFFNSLAKVEVLILLFAFFWFFSVVSRDSKVHESASIIIIIIIIIIITLWEFLTSPLTSRWLLAGVWGTTNCLKSPRLVSEFCLILTMYYYYFTPCKFFTPAMASGLSLVPE